MKLTEIDKRIIEVLEKESSLSERNICNRLNINYQTHRTTINRRLNKLYQKGIINKIKGYISIYYISITNIRKIEEFAIKCLYCGQDNTINKQQVTKICMNCKKRFIIKRRKRIKVGLPIMTQDTDTTMSCQFQYNYDTEKIYYETDKI